MSGKPQFNFMVKISCCLVAALYWVGTAAAIATPISPSLRVVINSDRNQPIQPDEALTLREAIALTNGTCLTASTPPADIIISHPLLITDTYHQFSEQFLLHQSDTPPQGVVIEPNWLGVQLDGIIPATRSAFGMYAFNSVGTTIRQNWIANYDGSSSSTSVRADRLQVSDNVVTNNGFAGMPDAIRLEGSIQNTQIHSNQFFGNAGSGVFLFRSEGAVQIQTNQIDGNGRRLHRAAIYLMGSNYQVINNLMSNQSGAGVAVTDYSQGNLAGQEALRRNRIQGNRFAKGYWQCCN